MSFALIPIGKASCTYIYIISRHVGLGNSFIYNSLRSLLIRTKLLSFSSSSLKALYNVCYSMLGNDFNRALFYFNHIRNCIKILLFKYVHLTCNLEEKNIFVILIIYGFKIIQLKNNAYFIPIVFIRLFIDTLTQTTRLEYVLRSKTV